MKTFKTFAPLRLRVNYQLLYPGIVKCKAIHIFFKFIGICLFPVESKISGIRNDGNIYIIVSMHPGFKRI